jgi:hypothetical protein
LLLILSAGPGIGANQEQAEHDKAREYREISTNVVEHGTTSFGNLKWKPGAVG